MDAPPSEALIQARLKKQRLANAYEVVFGQERRRSAEQKMVFADLSIGIGEDDETYKFQGHRDGIAIIASGLRRDGAQSIIRLIRIRLKDAGEPVEKPKRTGVVKK